MPRLPTTTSGRRSRATTCPTSTGTAPARRASITGRASLVVASSAREDARCPYSSSTGCVSASSRFRSSQRAAATAERPRRFGLFRRGLGRELKSRSLSSTGALVAEAVGQLSAGMPADFAARFFSRRENPPGIAAREGGRASPPHETRPERPSSCAGAVASASGSVSHCRSAGQLSSRMCGRSRSGWCRMRRPTRRLWQ
jgi:hypothetical protein